MRSLSASELEVVSGGVAPSKPEHSEESSPFTNEEVASALGGLIGGRFGGAWGGMWGAIAGGWAGRNIPLSGGVDIRRRYPI